MDANARRDRLTIENGHFRIRLAEDVHRLWSYQVLGSGDLYAIAPPAFEVDGKLREASLRSIAAAGDPVRLSNGCTEHRFTGELRLDPDLSLEVVFRVPDDNSVVRFQYALRSKRGRRLTKGSGGDRLRYFGASLAELPRVTEVRLSEFNEMVHSYCLAERLVEAGHFANELQLMGPMLVAEDDSRAVLIAYEHGATVPDAFVAFDLCRDRGVNVRAVKGNYYDGQVVDAEHPYETIWLQLAAVPGGQSDLARGYREFVLRHMTLNRETRAPYIFYNTWNFQERNRHWNGKAYLDSMHQERMLEEIEVAHRMGIEVFVIDTGWYEKTGDWRVNTKRFPDGLKRVREKLDLHGMKLGLWFNPTAAAVSSRMLSDHRDCVTSWRGKQGEPFPVWETEESHHMCLVSRYREAFAEELIRLHGEVGVTYFKWDAVGQYGCDDPGHDHGGPENDEQERADCYAFQLGRAMAWIVDRVCEKCPEAIVDFDVTEAGRCMGLAFLAVGKYYLVNNGPYYQNYNLPLPPDQNWNIFFYPGPARGWICRTPLAFDKWVPSVLFMTHYLADDPAESQLINVASLILGQNGIWGDLPKVSQEGVERIAHLFELYKQVRADITESHPVRSGPVAGCPEIHEKIWDRSGRGAVVAFAARPGSHTYVTENTTVQEHWHTEGVQVARDGEGRARLEMRFDRPGAKIVFFGVS
jgi:alpha-galactosidase